jgi:hypothetical protein
LAATIGSVTYNLFGQTDRWTPVRGPLQWDDFSIWSANSVQ